MNIAQHIENGTRLAPHRPAILFEKRIISYRELDERANRAAQLLRGVGIARGDRVALFLPNIPAWIFCYLGILKLGAIAVAVNSHLKVDEVGFVLQDSGAAALVTTPALYASVPRTGVTELHHVLLTEGLVDGTLSLESLMDEASPEMQAVEMDRDDPAVIVYTSGTTGVPKGAVLSHNNVIQNMRAKKRYMSVRPEDRLLLFLPLYHCFGQNAILNAALESQAAVVLHRQFEQTEIQTSLTEHGVTMFFGVPTTFIMMLERLSVQDMRTVRYCLSAAAVLPREIEDRWYEKFKLVIHQGYGLTESSPFASYNHPHTYRPGSIGVPIEGVEMKIVAVDDDRDLPPGEIGEIVIRGHNVMLGYWKRPAETAEVIRNGWLHSGDLGKMDEDGYFYIVDRLKDMINVGGLKVYPAEVENVLFRHPAVAEAAVYGVPDPWLGERVKASVVLRPAMVATAEELIALCSSRLADFKVPSWIDLVPALPKLPTGKIAKRHLRQTS